MTTINKKSRIPLYYQLMDIIIEGIEIGKFKEDDKLPSERELCERYGISRATVRQGIQELEKEGYIYKEHGKGTFVSPKRFNQDLLKIYSFTEEMKKLGKKPTSKVVDFDIIQCNEQIAKKINGKIKDLVYKFTRIRLADEEPMMIETSYVPYDRFPGITKEHLENEPMYDIFNKRFNTVLTMAEENFKAVKTKEEDAKLLNISTDIPSLMIERLAYEKNRIIEYTISVARGDRFEYRAVLKK
ncbi:GntR family transcriptional regulator [Dethiothermospora halolimnae]|uniref:GntR family transcriptional regulator n=1 Tax=Dethiothermospora halolimnae TaxID=3114390 RepID=UPI003CCC28F3